MIPEVNLFTGTGLFHTSAGKKLLLWLPSNNFVFFMILEKKMIVSRKEDYSFLKGLNTFS